MSDAIVDLGPSLKDTGKGPWLAQIREVAEAYGVYDTLGVRHVAALVDNGSTLLVTFETVQGIRSLREDAKPLGWSLIAREGWSNLCMISDGDTWFRDPLVIGYFDRLVDDGFFDTYETVLFYGAGPCGYAAAAFSVAAPGARVLAIQPQATLDPRVTEWDDRFVELRRTDFTRRYGYAPDMLDAAQAAFVLYDPREQLDAMHAALFTKTNVTKLRLRYMGAALQTDLMRMDLLEDLLIALSRDRLDTAYFARVWRGRRDYLPYLQNLLQSLTAAQRDDLSLVLCRHVTARHGAPRFATRLAELEAGQA